MSKWKRLRSRGIESIGQPFGKLFGDGQHPFTDSIHAAHFSLVLEPLPMNSESLVAGQQDVCATKIQ